jgi:phosphoglucosamine mutase
MEESKGSPVRFGTDGVRGEVGTELTAHLAQRIGAAAAAVLRRKEKNGCSIIIGRDTRRSGPMLGLALASGIASSGCDACMAGVIPTPGVSYLTRAEGFLAGVVISASHNPAKDNGIKFFSTSGEKLPDGVEREIEKLLETPSEPQQAQGNQVGEIRDGSALVSDYEEFLLSTAGPVLASLRVVVDCANGAFCSIAPRVLERLGAEVDAIFADPENGEINFGCGSLHPESMRDHVRQSGAQLGVSFDGDGDRAIFADENGCLVDGDRVLAILSAFSMERGRLPGRRVVATVMSNIGLERALTERGIDLVRTPVGDRFVWEEMKRTRASMGGEKSGHIIFSEFGTTGDGMITTLQLLRVMTETGKSLSELAQVAREYPQVLINIPVKRRDGWEEIPEIQAAIRTVEQELAESGRILVRASGTESLLRVMTEGPDFALVRKHAESVSAVIRRTLG